MQRLFKGTELIDLSRISQVQAGLIRSTSMARRSSKKLYVNLLLLSAMTVVPALGAFAKSGKAQYTNLDALRDVGPNKTGIDLIHKLTAAQVRILRNIDYSKEAKDVYRFANETVEDLDFDRFLDSSYGVRLRGRGFAFPFQSTMQSGAYRVNYVRRPIGDLQANNFLDALFQFVIKENPSIKTDPELGYGVTAEGVVVVDEFNQNFFGVLFKNYLSIIDPANLRILTPNKSEVFSGVSGLARKYVDDLVQTFPGSIKLLASLVEPSIKFQPEQRKGRELLDVQVKLRLNLSQIKQQYPHLGDYIQSIKDDLSFVSSTIVTTKDDLVLIKSIFNLAENSLEFRFKTVDGQLIPVSRSGEPVFSRGIDPESTSEFYGKIISGFKASVYGLTIENKGIEASIDYREGQTTVLRSKLQQVPVAKFRGGLFGFIPPGFLDIMMPGSLEGYAKIFGDGLVNGNAGKGAFAEVKFDSPGSGKSIMTSQITAEIKDDFFLTFGLRILNDYLWPDDDTISDFRELSTRVAICLDEDVEKLKPKYSAQNQPKSVGH